MRIESTKNEHIKNARALTHKKGRMEQGLHFVEGEKLVREALISGSVFNNAFIEEGHEEMACELAAAGANVLTVTRNVMESLCMTETPQWVAAAVKMPLYPLPVRYPKGLIVILDRLQDPGNLGTILRTADAMGALGVLLGEGSADPFAPKPVRAAMGSTFHIPIWFGVLTEELDKLKAQDFMLICGHLEGSEALPSPGDRAAVVIGNEGAGVSPEVAGKCVLARLPMYGKAESLNASVAAGILIYEMAKRMRGK